MPEYRPRAVLPERLDDFARGYLECAEWAGLCDDDAKQALELSVSPKWDQASLDRALGECASFQAECATDLEGIDPYQAGHDFFLTRNRDGAGFWDRGLGPVGDRLSEESRLFGEVYVYFDEDTETLFHE